MLHKFTYSHEHTFNRRDQYHDWKSSIRVLKANEER